MNRSTPLLVLGAFFIAMGVGFFVFTLRAAPPVAPAAAPKKSELRELEARRTETSKMRIAGAVLTAFGAVLVLIS